MKVTVFVDVLSHWCLVAAPAMEALSDAATPGLSFELAFAPLADGGPLGYAPELEQWFYRRGTLAYGSPLRCDWYENAEATTWWANAAAAAAVELGAEPVRTTRLMAHAAMVEGKLLGREDVAVQVAAEIASLDPSAIRARFAQPAFVARLLSGNVRLNAIGCSERPSWHFESENGDYATLQGVWQAEAILPLANALLADERAYARAGTPPLL